MESKTIKYVDEMTQILIGTWLSGRELQHLKTINPADITDNQNALAVISKIKSYYYSGISKGTKIGKSIRIKLMDELKRIGFDEAELCSLIDKAKDAQTAYTQQISRIYTWKTRKLLSEVDYGQPGTEQQAQMIIDTYKLDGVQTLKPPCTDVVKMVVEEINNPKDRVIIPTALKTLTKRIGGLRPQDLTAIGGRPATGKTAFVLQLALMAAKENLKVLLATEEMTAMACCRRMIANVSEGSLYMDKLTGNVPMTPEDVKFLEKASDIIDTLIQSGNLIILEGENELALIEQQIELHNPDVVIIDQLTQLQDSRHKFDSIRLKYCHLTSHLKAIALSTNVSIVLVAQLSRKAEDGGTPNNSWWKESGSIEEDADKAIILYKDPQDEDGEIQAWVTKNRDGEAGFHVDAALIGGRQRFVETIKEDDIPF